MRISAKDQAYARAKRSPDDSYAWQPRDNDNLLIHDSYAEKLVNTDDDSPGGLDMLLKFFFVMLGGFAIFIIVFVIIKCCHEDRPEEAQSRSRPASFQNRRRSTRSCSHRPCIINRFSHRSAGCLFETNNSQYRLTSEQNVVNNTNHFTTTAVVNDWSRETDHLDLPPTYNDSTTNSRASSTCSLHNLGNERNNHESNLGNNHTSVAPPSYAEALANTFAAATSVHHNHHGGHDDPGGRGDSSADVDSGGGGVGGDSGGGGGDGGGGGGDTGGGGGDSGGGGGDSGGGGGDSGGGGGDSGGGGGDSGGGGGDD